MEVEGCSLRLKGWRLRVKFEVKGWRLRGVI